MEQEKGFSLTDIEKIRNTFYNAFGITWSDNQKNMFEKYFFAYTSKNGDETQEDVCNAEKKRTPVNGLEEIDQTMIKRNKK
jgi:hypothetical protein